MFLNFILPTTFIFSLLIYVLKNDPHEIIFYSVFLLFPYLFLITKIRSIRVMKKLSPLETLITHGYIDQGLNPIFAILVERDKGSYLLYFNGNKKKQSIVSVQSFLSENTKQSRDRAFYIQIQLEKKLISYAPHKGSTLWGQAEYAQNILDDMIANGVETH